VFSIPKRPMNPPSSISGAFFQHVRIKADVTRSRSANFQNVLKIANVTAKGTIPPNHQWKRHQGFKETGQQAIKDNELPTRSRKR
jgi:hypothetical protein